MEIPRDYLRLLAAFGLAFLLLVPAAEAWKGHERVSGFYLDASGVSRATPTPNTPPSLLMAGYWDTNLTRGAGGTALLWVIASPKDGYPIEHLTFRYPALGVSFDFSAMLFTDLYWTEAGSFPPGMQPQRFFIELYAENLVGLRSDTWPYLTVVD